MSHDMEDIVAVLDGRSEVVSEIESAPDALRRHLVNQFRNLLESPPFREALAGHLPPDGASQARTPIILARIREIAEFG